MFGGALKVAAWTAAAAVTITLASGDAFARPGGGRSWHGPVGFHGGIDRGIRAYHGAGAYRGVHAYPYAYRGAGIVNRNVGVRHGGPYHIGGRYYGGVWYGPGRRWWNGRWYAYGVGSCWLWSPIGYVWICG